jgi:hydrogenase nickel incorporation protein HypA/HybF
MHDLYISRQIAREVISRARKEGASRVLEVKIRIGELTHLNPEQLDFWLREFFQNTFAQKAKILIEKTPPFIFCRECGYQGELELKNPYFLYFFTFLQCPHCRSDKIEISSGRECLLESIKIER